MREGHANQPVGNLSRHPGLLLGKREETNMIRRFLYRMGRALGLVRPLSPVEESMMEMIRRCEVLAKNAERRRCGRGW